MHKNLNEFCVHIFVKIEYGNGVELYPRKYGVCPSNLVIPNYSFLKLNAAMTQFYTF